MTISEGDLLPDVELAWMTPDGPERVRSRDVLGAGRAVLFAVPGAFTPTCSDHHLPGFVLRDADLRLEGIDTIACVSVNDVFVMGAWGDAQQADGILMLADASAELTTAMGLEVDLPRLGLGVRSRRYAAVLEDGRIEALLVEPGPGLDASSADSVLSHLRGHDREKV